MTFISLFIVLSVLAGCSTLGPLYEGFEGHSENFIKNHSERYRIVDDKVYPAPYSLKFE